MCFSAPASFAASATLIAIGSASLAGSKSKKQKIISLIPFAFAIQQALEGYQWLALESGAPNMPAAYGFLFFAFLFWPVFIPSVVLLNEKKPTLILRSFLVAGVGTTSLLLYSLLTYPLDVSILQNSIRYSVDIPNRLLTSVLYFLAICGSFFFSTDRRVQKFGVLIFFSGLISWIFYEAVFSSVWCFFSALLSSLIYLYIWSENAKKIIKS
jgi:hypothetical protein